MSAAARGRTQPAQVRRHPNERIAAQHATAGRRARQAAVMLFAGALLALGGCATSGPQPLYQWDGYQAQVYQSLNGATSPIEQIAALEKAQQDIRAKGGALPPGFRAHLGALYASIGKHDEALEQLYAEKAAFPEASTYMDFLTNNLKR